MTYKNEIIARLISRDYTGLPVDADRMLDKISAAISYAWNQWDNEIVSSFFEGEKPLHANPAFITSWVSDEDFDASGYDVEYLKELFEIA